MRCRLWLLPVLVAVGLTDPASAADKPKSSTTTHHLTQLRKQFTAWDLNKDGYLDKEEEEILKRVATTEKKLSAKVKAAERALLQTELQNEKNALNKLQSAMKAYEKQILKASSP